MPLVLCDGTEPEHCGLPETFEQSEPTEHWHTPLLQVKPLPHLLPQAPQLLASVSMSMQPLPQQVVPAGPRQARPCVDETLALQVVH